MVYGYRQGAQGARASLSGLHKLQHECVRCRPQAGLLMCKLTIPLRIDHCFNCPIVHLLHTSNYSVTTIHHSRYANANCTVKYKALLCFYV